MSKEEAREISIKIIHDLSNGRFMGKGNFIDTLVDMILLGEGTIENRLAYNYAKHMISIDDDMLSIIGADAMISCVLAT